MRLKTSYSSREVASLTGLTARQLQWWDAHHLVSSSIPSHRTPGGGYTERRYSPLDLLDLLLLADLRRRGFSVAKVRTLLASLREQFGMRLVEAVDGAGPVRLLTDGRHVYARTEGGGFFDLLSTPPQLLLSMGADATLEPIVFKESRARKAKRRRAQQATKERKGTAKAGRRRDEPAS